MRVVFEPDGSGWHVYIPAVQGCRSHGRSIAEARRNVREALAACSDVLPGAARLARTVLFVEDIRAPAEAQDAVDQALKAREALERTEDAAARAAARGARALRRAGLSLRDAGELLRLSHQRIKQLTEHG